MTIMTMAGLQSWGNTSTNPDINVTVNHKKEHTDKFALHNQIKDWHFDRTAMLDSGDLIIDDVGHKAKAIDNDHRSELTTLSMEKGERSQNQQGQQEDQRKDSEHAVAEIQYEFDLENKAAMELATAINQLSDKDLEVMRKVLKNPLNLLQGMARKVSYVIFPLGFVWDVLFAFRAAASFPQIERAVRAYEHCLMVIETRTIAEIMDDDKQTALNLVAQMAKDWNRVNPILKSNWFNSIEAESIVESILDLALIKARELASPGAGTLVSS